MEADMNIEEHLQAKLIKDLNFARYAPRLEYSEIMSKKHESVYQGYCVIYCSNMPLIDSKTIPECYREGKYIIRNHMRIMFVENGIVRRSNADMPAEYRGQDGIMAVYKNANGEKHRENDAPAINGTVQYWCKNDMTHRYDAPAFRKINGYRTGNPKDEPNSEEWWLFGTHVRKEDYLGFLNDNGIDITNITEEDKLLISMKYGR